MNIKDVHFLLFCLSEMQVGKPGNGCEMLDKIKNIEVSKKMHFLKRCETELRYSTTVPIQLKNELKPQPFGDLKHLFYFDYNEYDITFPKF